MNNLNIAILIPCFNEEKTIRKVIEDFKKELPKAEIFVFDNNSTDNSSKLAIEAGATVIKEKHQGKGFVVSSMLKKIVADIYIMVDADDTYPAESVHDLLAPVINEQCDMAVGQRLSSYSQKAFRPFHYNGNKIVCFFINSIFSSHLKDPMSGYRVFTREVAIDLPIVATGFDIETEMTLQLLYRHFIISEVEIQYRERPDGSYSKLNTFKDGAKVIYKVFSILQSYKPLTFFGSIGAVLLIISFFGNGSIINNNLYQISLTKTILYTSIFSLGLLFIFIGIILHNLNFRLLEISSVISKMFHLIDKLSNNKSGN